jgi:hypothetical protein
VLVLNSELVPANDSLEVVSFHSFDTHMYQEFLAVGQESGSLALSHA